mmetsp:Transcript_70173/g.168184  ORF Transcript_70173/g.168184 Transcript_70173/m.168184 type:complete len:491 (-) Transcript_70173:1182-2654(-)
MRSRRIDEARALSPPSSTNTMVDVSTSTGHKRSGLRLAASLSVAGWMDMSSLMSASGTLSLPSRASPSILARIVQRTYSLHSSRSLGKPTKMAWLPMCSMTHPDAAAALRSDPCPAGLFAQANSSSVSVTDVISIPSITSISSAPSRSSVMQLEFDLLQSPGHVLSEAAITRNAHALRQRSGPMMTSTRGADNHSCRCLSSLVDARMSLAGTSISVPSKSQHTRTVPASVPRSSTVAECQAPSYLTCTAASASIAIPPTSTVPGTSLAGGVVFGGSQAQKVPVSSWILSISCPASCLSANCGTLSNETQSSKPSVASSSALPNGPMEGRILVTMCSARLRSSGSPATAANLPITSRTASEAAATLDLCFEAASRCLLSSSFSIWTPNSNIAAGCLGCLSLSEKRPGSMRSTAAMTESCAAVRALCGPNMSKRPPGLPSRARFETAAAVGFKLEGRTSATGIAASPPPCHCTITSLASVKPVTSPKYQMSS